MEVIQVIETRRSIKSFLPKPIPEDVLLKLFDVVRYSPSGANKNAWHFVVTREKDALTRLGETQRFCRWLASAPAAIAIVADPSVTQYWLEDCSVAAYSIWLAATGLGLGVAWAAVYQSANTEESERRQQFVRDILSIPKNLAVPMVLAVGYPDQPPAAERKKPDVKDIVHWDHYASGGA